MFGLCCCPLRKYIGWDLDVLNGCHNQDHLTNLSLDDPDTLRARLSRCFLVFSGHTCGELAVEMPLANWPILADWVRSGGRMAVCGDRRLSMAACMPAGLGNLNAFAATVGSTFSFSDAGVVFDGCIGVEGVPLVAPGGPDSFPGQMVAVDVGLFVSGGTPLFVLPAHDGEFAGSPVMAIERVGEGWIIGVGARVQMLELRPGVNSPATIARFQREQCVFWNRFATYSDEEIL